MVTEDELKATGQSLVKAHKQAALLIAAMHMTCSCLLHRSNSNSEVLDVQQVLDDCVDARLRELGLTREDLEAAEMSVRRATAVLEYLGALPS